MKNFNKHKNINWFQTTAIDRLVINYESMKLRLNKENFKQEYLQCLKIFPDPSFQFTITKSFIKLVETNFGNVEFSIAFEKLEALKKRKVKGIIIERTNYTNPIPSWMKKKAKKKSRPKTSNPWSGKKLVPKPIINLSRE